MDVPAEAPTSIRHGYFVLQATVSATGSEFRLSGVVENLATGRKWRFETAEELCDHFKQWGGKAERPLVRGVV